MNVSIAFEHLEIFSNRYQRNNKRGGIKNMRCFPTCGDLHRERGFCGRSVGVLVNGSLDISNVVAITEFVPDMASTDDDLGKEFFNLQVGDFISNDTLRERTRDKTHPTRPWIAGEPEKVGISQTRFVFNSEKKGWHYGWNSNKHTCNALHVLQFALLERANDGFLVKAIQQTPKFMIFCRRRRRYDITPTAPIALPMRLKKKEANVTSSGRKGKKKETWKEDDEEDEQEEEEEAYVNESDSDVERDEIMGDDFTLASYGNTAKRIGPVRGSSSLSLSSLQDVTPSRKERKREEEEDDEKKKKKKKAKVVVDTVRMAKILKAVSIQLSKFDSNNGENSFPASSSSPAPHNNNNMDDFFFEDENLTADLAECLDYFENKDMTHSMGSSEPSDPFELEDLNLLRSTIPTPPLFPAFVPASMPSKDEVVRNLALFLLEETEFSNNLQELAASFRALSTSSNQQNNTSYKNAFNKFNVMLHNHVENFIKHYNYTWEQFDLIFEVNSTVKKEEEKIPAGNRGAGAGVLAAFEQVVVNSTKWQSESKKLQQSKFNGVWEMIENPMVEEVRAQVLGYPWLLRKMLSYMEGRFDVGYYDGDVLKIKLRRKLFSSGEMEIVLDGNEHAWGMQLPMFQGLSNRWTYRAWIDGEKKIYHIHKHGDLSLKRVMYVTDDSNELVFQISSISQMADGSVKVNAKREKERKKGELIFQKESDPVIQRAKRVE